MNANSATMPPVLPGGVRWTT